MIGIDRVINNVNTKFQTYLWPTVNDKDFSGRCFRNSRDGKLIPEVYVSNGEYREVKFNDAKNVVCFFDPQEKIEGIAKEINRDVNIIFAVKTTAIYSLAYRVTEEIYRDVIDVVHKYFYNLVKIDSIVAGLNAYGDFDVSNLKAYDMHPWHTFALQTNMIIDFQNC